MSKLEELLEDYCPDGVEFRKIKEVADCIAGATPSKTKYEYWENGTIPWLSSGEVNKVEIFDTDTKITQLGYDNSSTKMVPENTVVIALAGQGKTRGTVAITHLSLCTNQSLCSIVTKDELNPRFLFHYLRGQYGNLRKLSSGDGGRGGLNLKIIGNIEIPAPPLPVQEEIVRILDMFTGLTAELTDKLTAELTARKKQYEYYRDQMLAFDSDVKEMTLNEVCDYVDYRGKTPKKTSEGIMLVTAKNIRQGYIDYEVSKEFISPDDYEEVMHRGKPKIGDVLITTEAPCGYVAQVDNEHIALAQRVIKYRGKKEIIDNGYLKFILMGSDFQKKLSKAANGSTVKGIKGSKLHKLTIPVPPIDVQKRIVTVLDHFDTLCSDISDGLPAEIEAREKQYEYYRDKLLTFKRKA